MVHPHLQRYRLDAKIKSQKTDEKNTNDLLETRVRVKYGMLEGSANDTKNVSESKEWI